MTNSTSVTVIQENDTYENQFGALFADLDELEPFDVKKEELAAQLAALLSFAKVNRSDFARKSGWSRSRVTNVLNGSKNLTYKTMWEFARQLGYEADLIFRLPSQHMPLQPWQSSSTYVAYQHLDEDISTRTYPHSDIVLEFQSAVEVAIDLDNGRYKNCYISLASPEPEELTERGHLKQSVLSHTSSSIPLGLTLHTLSNTTR